MEVRLSTFVPVAAAGAAGAAAPEAQKLTGAYACAGLALGSAVQEKP